MCRYIQHAVTRNSCCPRRLCHSLTPVQFWQINRDGAPVAYFYLDPYSRPHEKRQVHLRSPAIYRYYCFLV